jgi:succinate dehydrogenase flavin-adding protein (antitoxin of CptAB toxin-antitoxin module)
LDTLRKKILYRAHYRGTKEADQVIGDFFCTVVPHADPATLQFLADFVQWADHVLMDCILPPHKGLSELAITSRQKLQELIEGYAARSCV